MTTTTPEVDYALVFEELSTLNRLLTHSTYYDSYTKPNPTEFEVVVDPFTFGAKSTVFKSLRSGMHFMAEVKPSGNGSGLRIGKFAPAQPRERTVIDWLWL